jgi:hypothetical protein
VIGCLVYGGGRERRLADLRRRRDGRLPYRLAVVRTTAAATARDHPPADELDEDAVAALRYVLDRALQPVGKYDGYEPAARLDPGALARQLVHAGLALAVLQAHYAPNLRGYLDEAQRRLIETCLDRRVWRGWRLAEGSTAVDPAAYVLVTALYASNTGDRRHLRLGALTFHDGGRPHHRHDLRTLAAQLDRALGAAPLGLARSRGDRVGVLTNVTALSALQVFDRVTASAAAEEHRDVIGPVVRDEFRRTSLDFVAGRSELTGIALPALSDLHSLAVTLHPAFPDLAVRTWALAREECFLEHDGRVVATPPDAARPDRPAATATALATLDRAAREHGDVQAADAARDALEQIYPPSVTAGVLSYEGASPALTIRLAASRLLYRGAWRAAICLPSRPSAHDGPLLHAYAYPAVLAAKAVSSGADLDLVLYPGAGTGVRELPISQLRSRGRYVVTTPHATTEIEASSHGTAVVDVHLAGRTPVTIRPA